MKMARKHCNKHYRYVASCPDCQALNAQEPPNDELDDGKKRLYQDIPIEGDEEQEKPKPRESQRDTRTRRGPEIPEMRGRPGPGGGKPPRRFEYKPKRTRTPKKVKRIIIIVIIIIILIVSIYGIPVWHAKVSLLEQLYYNKSDGVLYWDDIYTLNGWSTAFFFNKTALIGACIGSFLMCIPPERSLLTIIRQRMGRSPLSTKKTIIFWWTGGFILFYLISQGIDNGYFSLTMYMFDKGILTTDDLTNGNIFNAFKMLSNPNQVSYIDIYVFQTVVHPIINFIIGIVIFRLILNIINYLYLDSNNLKMIAMILFVISMGFLLALFNAVGSPKDALSLIRIYSVWIGIIAFFIMGLFVLYYEKTQSPGGAVEFSETMRKRTVTAAVVIIIVILIPVFAAVPKQINLSQYEKWKEYEWDVRYSREIEWTRRAAGIELDGGGNIFQTRDIYNYSDNVMSTDNQIISSTRQFDKGSSGKRLFKEIRSSYETMADSDIIYIDGVGEYWIAPKTLDMGFLGGDAVNLHTEKYDHVEGFVALDTSTGEIVDPLLYKNIFGISMDESNIFFGEREDLSYTTSSSSDQPYFNSIKAFDNDILLDTDWGNKTYKGVEDGTLSGLEAFWYTIDMGLTNYAFDGQEKKILTNRNVHSRVSSVLLPGLQLDSDPYLVFNKEESKMYYCMSLYTSTPLEGYSQSQIYRFIGVVLVDVETGDLLWYKNPNLPVPANDPLYKLWNIYDVQYPWDPTPSWLLSQMRYPENLWESQLNVDYTYHIQDPITWNNGNDLYERPDSSDTFYIETDVGYGLEFVAIDFVEYIGSGATKLAGVYLLRMGEHLGETLFYRVPKTETLIGPETAKSQLSTSVQNDARYSDFISESPRFGNKLLYPIAGSLYYYIPVYSQTVDSYGDTYENLGLCGLINAFNTTKVYYGDDVWEAYNVLAQDIITGGESEVNVSDISLDVASDNEVVYDENDWSLHTVTINYWNTTANILNRNVTLNLTIQTSQLPADQYLDFNVSLLYGSPITGYNYTISGTSIPALNYSIGDYMLNPGEGSIFTVQFKPEYFMGPVTDIFLYRFDLLDADNGNELIATTDWTSISFTLD